MTQQEFDEKFQKGECVCGEMRHFQCPQHGGSANRTSVGKIYMPEDPSEANLCDSCQ